MSKEARSWDSKPPLPISDKASRFYISIDSKYLSEAYNLSDGDIVSGKIIKIFHQREELKELSNREIKFILYKLLGDTLFILKEDWEELREYGLVTNFIVSVRLEKAICKDGKEIPLYSKRDLEI